VRAQAAGVRKYQRPEEILPQSVSLNVTFFRSTLPLSASKRTWRTMSSIWTLYIGSFVSSFAES
jgi:hypothetical protein